MNNQTSTSTEPAPPTFQEQLTSKNEDLAKIKSQYAKSSEVLKSSVLDCNLAYSSALKDLQLTFSANEEYMAMIVNFQSQKISELTESHKSTADTFVQNAAEIKRLSEENTKLSHSCTTSADTTAKLQTRNNALQPELNKLQKKYNDMLGLQRTKDQQLQKHTMAQVELTKTIQQLRDRTNMLAQSNNVTGKRFSYAWTELMNADMRAMLNTHFKIELPHPKIEVITEPEPEPAREDNIAGHTDEEAS
jgi:FtsZ-binding cell division protein ZapB